MGPKVKGSLAWWDTGLRGPMLGKDSPWLWGCWWGKEAWEECEALSMLLRVED